MKVSIGKTLSGGTVALALLLGSCTSEKHETGPGGVACMADSLFSDDADIRQFSFGMAREEFIPSNDKNILENERDFVVESIKLKTRDSIFAECSYRFENDLLQSGEINIFCPADSLNHMMQDTLLKVLGRRFGQVMESRGFYTWKTKSKRGYGLEIFMGDVSQELGSPGQFVTGIRFYAELVEKPMMAFFAPCSAPHP